MLKLNLFLSICLALFSLNNFAVAQEQSNPGVNDGTIKNLQPGKALEMPKPKFPPTAKALGISGQVNVFVTIDENGRVIAAVAKSGSPLLAAAAVEAAKLATFTPTILDGKAVRVKATVAYNFIRSPNWEKIGLSLGSIESQIPVFGDDDTESDFISKELGELKNELADILQEKDIKNKARLAAKAINLIHQKLLIQEPTSAWHFRLGVVRSKFSIKTGAENLFADNLPKIKELFDSASSDVPLERLDDLSRVLTFSNKPNLTVKDKQEIIRLLTESYNKMINSPRE